MKPILKWAGGKRRLIAKIKPYLPETFGDYYEPFFGGGAMFFDLAPERAIVGDANEDLVRTYRTICGWPEQVARELHHLASAHTEEHYYRVRDAWNSGEAYGRPSKRAAMMIYLNKSSYCGIWRVNKKGHLNVPMARGLTPKWPSAEDIRTASTALKSVMRWTSDYRECVSTAQTGDLIYMDPPYDGTWCGYTAGGFGEAEQRELADIAQGLASRGCHVIVSSSDTPMVRDLYTGWEVIEITSVRTIARSRQSRARELLLRAVM